MVAHKRVEVQYVSEEKLDRHKDSASITSEKDKELSLEVEDKELSLEAKAEEAGVDQDRGSKVTSRGQPSHIHKHIRRILVTNILILSEEAVDATSSAGTPIQHAKSSRQRV